MQLSISEVHDAPDPSRQVQDTDNVLLSLAPDTTPSLVHAGEIKLGSQLDETSNTTDEPSWIVTAEPPVKIATMGATITVRPTEEDPGTERLLPPLRVPLATTDKLNV